MNTRGRRNDTHRRGGVSLHRGGACGGGGGGGWRADGATAAARMHRTSRKDGPSARRPALKSPGMAAIHSSIVTSPSPSTSSFDIMFSIPGICERHDSRVRPRRAAESPWGARGSLVLCDQCQNRSMVTRVHAPRQRTLQLCFFAWFLTLAEDRGVS